MNKLEAAQYLGVSIRALERYVQQGRISVTYEKGKTRPTANFNEDELNEFKEELNEPTIKPAFKNRQIATEVHETSAEITLRAGEVLADSGEILVIEKLAGIIDQLLHQENQHQSVPVADKLLLTLVEAQALTGLSGAFLRSEIASGNLKGKKVGKSFRFRRSDQEVFVNSLF